MHAQSIHNNSVNPKLILHVGMPKTGTSSIQQTLFHSLQDRNFQYLGLGLVNSSRSLQCLVGDEPIAKHTYQTKRLNPTEVIKQREFFQQCWERQFRRVRRKGVTPIISAEDCWFMNTSELKRLKESVQNKGFSIHVLVYLRTPIAWLSSMFQEMVKSGHHTFADELFGFTNPSIKKSPMIELDYMERLTTFEQVFGCGNLTVKHFDRKQLKDGCVVSDFFQSCGIGYKPTRIHRINESIGLDATRLLYCYNKYYREVDALPNWKFLLLLETLRELKGPSVQLHPALLEHLKTFHEQQFADINSIHKIDLSNEPYRLENTLLEEKDMFNFQIASLEWLNRLSSSNTIGRVDRLKEIAKQVGSIEPRFTRRLKCMIQGHITKWKLRSANRR